jgi:hypothetical protein
MPVRIMEMGIAMMVEQDQTSERFMLARVSLQRDSQPLVV